MSMSRAASGRSTWRWFESALGVPPTISKIAPDWAARDPESRYIVIPGAGHNANQDNPTFFNRLLLEFLDEQ